MHHFFLFQIRAYGSTLFMESLDLRLCLKFLDDVDKNLPQCSAKWCLRAGIIGTKGWNLLLRLYSLRDWVYANNFWVVQFHACQNRVFFLLNTDYFEWEWFYRQNLYKTQKSKLWLSIFIAGIVYKISKVQVFYEAYKKVDKITQLAWNLLSINI